ncbi:hypothetical protein C0992_008297, partial [Termitomyces sp. T32_za158]
MEDSVLVLVTNGGERLRSMLLGIFTDIFEVTVSACEEALSAAEGAIAVGCPGDLRMLVSITACCCCAVTVEWRFGYSSNIAELASNVEIVASALAPSLVKRSSVLVPARHVPSVTCKSFGMGYPHAHVGGVPPFPSVVIRQIQVPKMESIRWNVQKGDDSAPHQSNCSGVQQNWFHSLYFKSWVAGSILAITYMPIVAVLTRSDPLKRREGVERNIIVRLTKFSELNTIRVLFRFLFTVPPLILGIDGMRPHHHVNESMFWTDILVMLAGLGCVISSSITLVIFFPRSIEREIAARDERERSKSRNSDVYRDSFYESRDEFSDTTQHSARTFNYGTPVPGSRLLASPPRTAVEVETDKKAVNKASSVVRAVGEPSRSGSIDKFWADEQDTFASLPPLRPNRKKVDGVRCGGVDQVTRSNM